MTLTNKLALTPPLGWNSWDCYGTTVREEEVKANADYMAAYMLKYGWTYVIVDIQWYEPNAKAGGYRSHADLTMDAYGRLTPATNRFPSAADGAGFKPLADYVHSLGLKFGIHIMRGIPHQAVERNLPILNTTYRAQDIADMTRICPWNDDMVGIDLSKPGAQAYYDSIIALYVSWDVDYIKADDMLYPYHDTEIAALQDAIRRSGREIVLSLSPGVELTTDYAEHLQQNCDLFRISGDFWDRWVDLKDQFEICYRWSPYSGPGCWADADMLPLGRIGIRAERGVDRQSLLTQDEQTMLMTLWAISRSPLMFGGDLPSNDDFTLSLLTNDEVMAVLSSSCDNHQLFRHDDHVVWIAKEEGSDAIYLALFNLADTPTSLTVNLTEFGHAIYHLRNLWTRSDQESVSLLTQSLAPHASVFYRLYPAC